jgi:hypothetical protein
MQQEREERHRMKAGATVSRNIVSTDDSITNLSTVKKPPPPHLDLHEAMKMRKFSMTTNKFLLDLQE